MTNLPELNDSLADLLGGVDEAKASNPVQAPDNYVSGTGRPNKFKDARLYTETCRKCGGSGVYRAPSSYGCRCFECDGAGSKTFKTSPESRAKAKSDKAARKAKLTQDAIDLFTAQHPEIVAWINEKAAVGNNFASSLLTSLQTYGSLTPNQIAAIERSKVRDAERIVNAAARIENAPVVDTSGINRLKTAFDAAKAYAANKGNSIRNLRITLGSMVISPAGDNSKNPGALYVKNNGEYLGKIAAGKFFSVRECSSDQEKQVLAFVADPKAAAKAYGQETGVCCICNATLTNKESIEAGIGPICATKFGW
jgi:hypothetical protein